MKAARVKKLENAAKFDRERVVERRWVKNQLTNNQKNAMKALEIAHQQEKEKLESGNYEYTRGCLRTRVLVKIKKSKK